MLLRTIAMNWQSLERHGTPASALQRAWRREIFSLLERYRDHWLLGASVYAVGMGAAIWQASAFENAQAGRVAGGQGHDGGGPAPEERRQRMWWAKMFRNFRENFKACGQYEYLNSLPENLEGFGPWSELPDHLR